MVAGSDKTELFMNAYDLHGHCAERLRDFPLYSQDGQTNPRVGIKLFNAFGSGTWYLTEYDPEERRAFCFVVGLAYDEWGYISLDEMVEVRKHGVQVIEVDLYFKPCAFREALRR